ncbi:MAG: hypothetical protein GF384_05880 [Elusimicrobia bacterium]|nr:hypothetical protein [Elusimicrobiota bacterium]
MDKAFAFYIMASRDNAEMPVPDVETFFTYDYFETLWKSMFVFDRIVDITDDLKPGAVERSERMCRELWRTIDMFYRESLPNPAHEQWPKEYVRVLKQWSSSRKVLSLREAKEWHLLTTSFNEEKKILEIGYPLFKSFKPISIGEHTYYPFEKDHPIVLVNVKELIKDLQDQLPQNPDTIEELVKGLFVQWTPLLQYNVKLMHEEDETDFDETILFVRIEKMAENHYIVQRVILDSVYSIERIVELLVGVMLNCTISGVRKLEPFAGLFFRDYIKDVDSEGQKKDVPAKRLYETAKTPDEHAVIQRIVNWEKEEESSWHDKAQSINTSNPGQQESLLQAH